MRNQVYCLFRRLRTKYFAPSLLADGGELELRVTGVHTVNLFLGGSAQHFYNLDQLVNARLAWEQGLSD